MLRIIAWISVFVTLLMGLTVQAFGWLIVSLALFSMLNAAGIPLLDTLAGIWQKQLHIDYGKIRLIGSCAFVVGVVIFGSLIDQLGNPSIIWILLGLVVCYASVQLFTPHIPPQDDNAQNVLATTQVTLLDKPVTYRQILQNRTTLRFLTAVALIQGSHAAYYTYSTIYWVEQGISIQISSLLWGLAVIAEVVLFFFSSRLFKSWSISALFYLTAIAACLRWLLFSYADNLVFIMLLQLMHCLTYAANHYAIVRYIFTQPDQHIVKLQALYSGISSCIAIAVLTFISGIAYRYSPLLAFISMALFAGAAIFVIPHKNPVKLQTVQ